VHTPLAIVGLILGLPLFVATAEIMRGKPGNADYAVMLAIGSLLYGLASYLVLLIVRRVRHSRL